MYVVTFLSGPSTNLHIIAESTYVLSYMSLYMLWFMANQGNPYFIITMIKITNIGLNIELYFILYIYMLTIHACAHTTPYKFHQKHVTFALYFMTCLAVLHTLHYSWFSYRP